MNFSTFKQTSRILSFTHLDESLSKEAATFGVQFCYNLSVKSRRVVYLARACDAANELNLRGKVACSLSAAYQYSRSPHSRTLLIFMEDRRIASTNGHVWQTNCKIRSDHMAACYWVPYSALSFAFHLFRLE